MTGEVSKMNAWLMTIMFVLPTAAVGAGLGPIDDGVPTYVCKRATGAIKIDGKLDEASWEKAEPTAEFVFPWPEQPGEKQRTEGKLIWDDEALYVGYTCRDKDIVAKFEDRDDPVYRDDCVEIFINPAPAQTAYYYGLEMNCRGVLYDYFYIWPTTLLKRFDLEGAELATTWIGTLNDSSDRDRVWYLEVRIPFENFEAFYPDPPGDGERWRVQMNRWDGTDKRALSEWTPSGKDWPDPHRPRGFGILEFSGAPVGSD